MTRTQQGRKLGQRHLQEWQWAWFELAVAICVREWLYNEICACTQCISCEVNHVELTQWGVQELGRQQRRRSWTWLAFAFA